MEKQTSGETASQKLLEMIQKDGYTAGDKLPAEAELVEPPGAGHNTVQEALRILMSRNIATTRQGSGTFISDKNGVSDDPPGFAMIEDWRKLTGDLIQVRAMLEPPIAALVAQNAAEEDIRELENIPLGLGEQMTRREDYSGKDSQLHTQIADCSHNLVMANLVSIITDGVRIFTGAVQETEYKQTLKFHRRIFEAIRDRRPVEVQQAMCFHLVYNDNRYKGEMRDGKQGIRIEEQRKAGNRIDAETPRVRFSE